MADRKATYRCARGTDRDALTGLNGHRAIGGLELEAFGCQNAEFLRGRVQTEALLATQALRLDGEAPRVEACSIFLRTNDLRMI